MKCAAAFTVLAGVCGLVGWMIWQVPALLIIIGSALVVTWAIFTAIGCLQERGIL